MKYDKVNGDVGFLEEPHKYVNLKDDSIQYISVTTLIDKYVPEYNKDFWSKYKALEKLMSPDEWKNIKPSLLKSEKFDDTILEAYSISKLEFNATQQTILDSWMEENRKSCERGTLIHSKLENALYNKGEDINLQKFGIGGKFTCKKGYNTLDMKYGVYPEYLIYYDNPKIGLHIAGQIDLLIKNGNHITLGDHKTNKKLEFKGFFNPYSRKKKMMKFPMNYMEDCNFNHYQLQLSIYAWMLQKLNPEFIIDRLFINYYDHEGNNKIYECEYLKDDVERMLKHFAKQQIIEKQNAKYKKFEY